MSKRFTINHWDTFDNTDFTVGEEDTLDDAIAFIKKEYGSSLRSDGADKVQIYDNQEHVFVRSFNIS